MTLPTRADFLKNAEETKQKLGGRPGAAKDSPSIPVPTSAPAGGADVAPAPRSRPRASSAEATTPAPAAGTVTRTAPQSNRVAAPVATTGREALKAKKAAQATSAAAAPAVKKSAVVDQSPAARVARARAHAEAVAARKREEAGLPPLQRPAAAPAPAPAPDPRIVEVEDFDADFDDDDFAGLTSAKPFDFDDDEDERLRKEADEAEKFVDAYTKQFTDLGLEAPRAARRRTATRRRATRTRPVTPRDTKILTFLYLAKAARMEHVKTALDAERTRGTDTKLSDASVRRALYRLQEMGLAHTESAGPFMMWMITPAGRRALDVEDVHRAVSEGQKKHTLAIASLISVAFAVRAVVVSDAEMASWESSNRADKDVLDPNGPDTAGVVSMDTLAGEDYPVDYEAADPGASVAAWMLFRPDRSRIDDFSTENNRGYLENRFEKLSSRPDLVTLMERSGEVGEAPTVRAGGDSDLLVTAYEVELNTKPDLKIVFKLAGYVDAINEGRFDEVVFYCSNAVRNSILRARVKHGRRSRWNDGPDGYQAPDPAWEHIHIEVINEVTFGVDGLRADLARRPAKRR